mgnify:CR=1 FL=1
MSVVALGAAAVATGPALAGLDVIECAATNGTSQCTATGDAQWATNYTSLDIHGNPRFLAEFRFVSEDNMIAFENSPFTYAPKYGGFCAMGLSNRSWSASHVGPPVDTARGWRVLTDPDTGLEELFLFSSDDAANAFIDGLPETKKLADKIWHGWYGDHGSLPPYGELGGPFNKMCFVGGPRDCAVDPQPLPREVSSSVPVDTTDPLPTNDPTNQSGWVLYEPLTDEFEGEVLDHSKWSTDPSVVGWKGRQPGLFDESNVQARVCALFVAGKWFRGIPSNNNTPPHCCYPGLRRLRMEVSSCLHGQPRGPTLRSHQGTETSQPVLFTP